MHAILETAADGIIAIGERNRIESFNPAAERMFGYAAEEVVGQRVAVLMPRPYRKMHEARVEQHLKTKRRDLPGGTPHEVVGRRKDGTLFPMELFVSEVVLDDRRVFTGICRDISERKALEREVLAISTGEQQRIGGELHDGLGQVLTGLACLAQSLHRDLETGDPARAEAAAELGRGIQTALGQVRTLVKGLAPVQLDADSLQAALWELAADTERRCEVACRFSCGSSARIDDGHVATHLYRIAQEAVTNAVRHGRPRNISIGLKTENGRIALTVADDGVGMQDGREPTTGRGLHIMRYRAGMIGGSLHVESAPDGGTVITCMKVRDGDDARYDHDEDRNDPAAPPGD